MTYKKTSARVDFEHQLSRALHELQGIDRSLKGSPVNPERLLPAYYVYVFSLLEVYIKQFFEDSVMALSMVSPSLGRWPDEMIGIFFHKKVNLGAAYRSYGNNEDEYALVGAVASSVKLMHKWSVTGVIPQSLTADIILDRKKYPSPQNVSHILRRIGIKDPWATIDSAGRFSGKTLLTSLNDLRTSIAHDGQLPPGFGYSDFKERAGQIGRFVAAIDRAVSRHFCASMMSRSEWNRHMARFEAPGVQFSGAS